MDGRAKGARLDWLGGGQNDGFRTWSLAPAWHWDGSGMAPDQTRLVPASSGSFLGRKWPSATSSRQMQMQVQIANADAARVPPSATRYFVSFVSFVRQDGAKRIDKFGK